MIEFNENMVKKMKKKKTERENKGLAKDINNMRAIINTLAPSLEKAESKLLEI